MSSITPINQDKRIIAIKIPGVDGLGLRSFSMEEQVSRLFQIEADLSGELDQTIDFDKVVGHPVAIQLDVRKGGGVGKRNFYGIVSRMVQTANENNYCHYHVTIVPWLWFLTRTTNSKVWEAKDGPAGKTVPEVIKAVFQQHGFSDYKLNLIHTYPALEFCVQYRETDFDFVSRLMEQEGIYYYFEHQDGKHTLVLVDDRSSHKKLPTYEIPFQPDAPYAITDWIMEKQVQPVATALQDFNFKKPKLDLLAKSNVGRKYGGAVYEVYDCPGEYEDHDAGVRYADLRLAELQTQYETLHGQANVRTLTLGSTFKLKKHPRADQERDYLITGISLRADAGEFGSTAGGAGSSEFFSCNFTCIDNTQQFRPARLTPKPVVQGVQTAIVTGTPGQEIDVDEYGRVKVHFHWNRYDKSDHDSSCWIRVSQSWTGNRWGHIANPHMGEEVIVAFLEGDPDRPIIVGRVYNEDHMPPYPLPQAAAVIGMKSQSTKTTGKFNIAGDAKSSVNAKAKK